MLWGTSSLALYIPWAGNAGPYLGICLWLWLGVLDAIQGVGLGMILLQVTFFLCHWHTTFTKYHDDADALKTPCLCDPGICADYWICMCDGCSCHCPEQDWSGKRLSRCGPMGLPARAEWESHGICPLLDCTHLPAHHRHWVFLVLPQGAAL
jgi:hypothetical protein